MQVELPDQSIRSDFRRDGFYVARNVLASDEVNRLRRSLRHHFAARWHWEGLGKHQPNAATVIPEISWIFTQPRILNIFRELAGSDHLVFTGNCDAHSNMLSWWHKDTGEREGGCFKGDYFARDDLRVYRAGIYLQDHDTDGHGLHVRPGSHHRRSVSKGAFETLQTRAGDVVFFDIRLSHAGQLADPFEAALLRVARRLRLPRAGYEVREVWRRLTRKQPKLSLFFTYAAPGQETLDYCDFEMNTRRRSGDPALVTLPPDLLATLASRGVECNPGLMPAQLEVRRPRIALSPIQTACNPGPP